jgi:ABC-type branched-subunit amino acid transport system ATPase component
MPGRNLSTTEKRLEKWWNSSAKTDFHLLEGISVKSTTPDGLRGIREIDLAFSYPVTVIAGANGAGKTTLLGLAALGFHAVTGHFPRGARRQPRPGEKSTYYTFQDFFFRGPGDPDITGLQVVWRYRGRPELKINKETDKWMRYERRPERPVHHFGIGRAVPAIEQGVLRTHFGGAGRAKNKGVQLSTQAVKWVAQILQRKYTGANKLSSQRYGLRQCQSGQGASYSSFNMGAGEDLLFDLIGSIDNAPDGSLILIEEVEVGIHASALRRLAEVLLEIALKKKLQIILTSHSEQFVDALPRQARILVRRIGEVHQVSASISTGYIFSELSGEAMPELKIYCEDQFAKRLIESSLAAELRTRVRVQAVGDKNTLADVAAYHVMSNEKQPCIVVWDADVTESEATGIAKKAIDKLKVKPFKYCRLPGIDVPEKSVVNAILDSDEALNFFATAANVTLTSAHSALEAALAEANHHAMPFVIAKRLGLTDAEAVTSLTQAVSRSGALDLSEISDAVSKLL